MLVPFLSSRMVKLMMTHGFCADGIVGLATAAHSVVSTIILYVYVEVWVLFLLSNTLLAVLS